MQSVIGMALRSLGALFLVLYIVFSRETGQWMADNLGSRADSFCQPAGAAARHFKLNRGQCDSPVAGKTAGPHLESLWMNIRAMLAQRTGH